MSSVLPAALLRRLQGLDLRFSCLAEEASFSKSLERDVVRATCFLCLFMGVGMLIFFITDLRHEFVRPGKPFRFGAADPRTALMLIVMTVFLWGCFLGTAAFLRLRLQRLKSCNWEALALATVTVGSLVMIVGNKATLSRAYGIDIAEAFWRVPPMSSETNVILVTCFVISWVCFFCPIRWHRFWIMPLICSLTLVVATVCFNFFNRAWGPCYLASMICLSQMCAAWQSEKNKRETWRLIQALQEQEDELERRCRGTMRLLGSFCDCVLILGQDLQTLDPSPHLAILLRRAEKTIQKGTCICDLLAADDCLRFISAVDASSSVDGENIAESLTVRMCDSTKNYVSVHLYIASMNKAEGPQYMVGIVQASEAEYPSSDCFDTTAFGSREDGSSISELGSRGGASHSSCAADDVLVSCSDHGDLSSCTSSADRRPLIRQNTANQGALRASISMSLEMEIHDHSDAFADAFGIGADRPCKHFRDCLEDADDFCQWLVSQQIEIMSGQMDLPTVREYGIVDMRGRRDEKTQAQWLSINLPVPDSEDAVLAGNYLVTVRLTPPTTCRARKALAKQLSRPAVLPPLAVLPTLPDLPGSV